MKKHELSKYDFDLIERALSTFIGESSIAEPKAEQLKDLFAKAQTGWLEMEDE